MLRLTNITLHKYHFHYADKCLQIQCYKTIMNGSKRTEVEVTTKQNSIEKFPLVWRMPRQTGHQSRRKLTFALLYNQADNAFS